MVVRVGDGRGGLRDVVSTVLINLELRTYNSELRIIVTAHDDVISTAIPDQVKVTLGDPSEFADRRRLIGAHPA